MVEIGMPIAQNVLVTGATGFVGQHLCSALLSQGFSVRAAIRSDSQLSIADGYEAVVIGEIDAQTDWSAQFAHIDCVVHCAARAHMMDEAKVDPLEAYRTVNIDGNRRLAEQAADAGVRRLIFLSSIKVNGERSISGDCFVSSDNAFPQDAYGISKWEAEQGLREVAAQTGLEVVIIRPPLVYGPGVKGNFLSMLNWLSHGVPLLSVQFIINVAWLELITWWI